MIKSLRVVSANSNMADAKVKLDKLNKRNFEIWKFKMELLLTKDGLFDMLTSMKPEVAADQAAWLVKDGKARGMIGLAGSWCTSSGNRRQKSCGIRC